MGVYFVNPQTKNLFFFFPEIVKLSSEYMSYNSWNRKTTLPGVQKMHEQKRHPFF
jgi:hypothetical protein